MSTIGTELAPVLTSVAIIVFVALVKAFGEVFVSFIQTKKDAIVAKIGATKYDSNLAVAREVWGIVDEHFRINSTLSKTVDSAAAKFEEEMLKVVPGLTQDEIDHLRQAVAGEVNKGRAVITSNASATSSQIEAQAAEAEAAKLNTLKLVAKDLGITDADSMSIYSLQSAITVAISN